MRLTLLSLLFFLLLPLFGECFTSGDTLKKHSSKYFIADRATLDSGLTPVEFYFPQYYISTAVKSGKLQVYNPSSLSGELLPYSAIDAQSLFYYNDSAVHYSEDLTTEYYVFFIVEMTDFITDGYQFNEKLYADQSRKKICFKVDGVLFLLNRKQMDVPFYYYVPPSDTSIFSYDYLTLKNQLDSLSVSQLGADERESLNAMLTGCVEWGERGSCSIEQNGVLLSKKETKKLRKSLKDISLMKDVSKVRLECDWYFNPQSFAFAKQVTKASLIDSNNKVLFTFLFNR